MPEPDIVFPDFTDFDDIEDFETECLRIINDKTELLIGYVSKDVAIDDFMGPADYLEALCVYVEDRTPFLCSHPYGE